jgi:hypothetical protein
MAIDLRRGGRTDDVYGVLVDPWNIETEYERVDIGKWELSRNYYTDEMVTGEITVGPSFPDINNRLLRIYLDAELDGEKQRIELGTFYMRRRGGTVSEGIATRRIELHSTLLQIISCRSTMHHTAKSGNSALAELKMIISFADGSYWSGRPQKFRVASGIKDTYFRENAGFKPGSTEYEIASYCAEYIDCELVPDTHGNVVCQPYLLPEERPIVWTFEDGINCMYEGDFVVDTNEDDIPTDVAVAYSQGDVYYYAFHSLPSSSPYSSAQRGRAVSAYFSYSDLPLIVGWWVEAVRDCKLYAKKDTASTVVHDLWKGGGVVLSRPVEGEWVYIENWVDGAGSSTGWAEAKNFFSGEAVRRKAAEYYSKITSLAIAVEFSHHLAPVTIGDAVRFIRGTTNVTGIVHAQELVDEPGIRTRTVIDVIGGALGGIYP